MSKLQPAALAIVFNEDFSKILLVKRKDTPIWVLPGGGIELGESPQEAAVRETLEETGLNVSIERQSGEYSPINQLASLTCVFVCKEKNGALIKTDETSDVQFFKRDQLPSNLFFLHQIWIEDAIKNKNIIKRPIHEVTYWGAFKYALKHPLQAIQYLITRLLKKD